MRPFVLKLKCYSAVPYTLHHRVMTRFFFSLFSIKLYQFIRRIIRVARAHNQFVHVYINLIVNIKHQMVMSIHTQPITLIFAASVDVAFRPFHVFSQFNFSFIFHSLSRYCVRFPF